MIRVLDKDGNIKVKQTVVSASGSAPTSAAYTSLVNRVSGNSAQMVSADNAISNAVSVVSAAAATKNTIITIIDDGTTTLSNPSFIDFVGAGVQVSVSGSKAIVSIGAGGSVTSANFVSLRSVVQANSAQMTSADNAISNAVSIVSAAQAATSAAVTSVNQIVSVLSQAVSVISQQVSVLSARVAGNSAQMTSADDAISNAVSIVSAAQAATSADLTSVKNIVSSLSQAVSVISQQVSVLSARVAGNSADFTSFKASINNLGDVSTSSPTSTQVLGYISATGQWVNTAQATASVTSAEYLSLINRVSTNSAQMVSADNAISNAVSIVSAAQAVTSAAVTSVNQVVSVISQQVSIISQQLSVLSARVDGNSTQMTSADNAISNAVSILSTVVSNQGSAIQTNSADVTSLKNRVSSISADFTSFKQSINNFGDVSTSSPVSTQILRYVSATGQWTNQTITGGSGSVTSANFISLRSVVQANSAQMTSADDAISNAVSIVSAAQAVTSAAVTSVNQIISVISQQVSVLSARVAGNSADFTSFKASLNNFGDVSISSPVSSQYLGYDSATAQWLNKTVPGGSGSVTSTEYLSLVDRVSTNSAQMTSADNAISNAVSIVSAAQAVTSAAVTSINQVISVISQQVSVISQQISVLSQANSAAHVSIMSAISVNSAQMTSADNAISNAVSVLSTVVSNNGSAIQANSADVTSLKNRVSANSATLSNAQSAIVANSAQMTSADNAISNAVSIVSAAAASIASVLSTTRSSLSALSADFTSFKASLNNFGDVSTSSHSDGQVLMYNASAGQWFNSTAPGGTASVTSAEYASTQSVVSTIQYPAIESVTSATYSVVEADRGKIKYFNNTASIEVVLPDGLTSGFQAIIYRNVSAGPIRFSATTSVEAQGSALNDNRTAATIIHRGANLWIALGAFLPAELGTLSNQISVLSQAVSVLSQSVSVLSQAVSVLSVQVSQNTAAVKVVTDTQGISATTFGSANSKISGLSVSCGANAVYLIEGRLIFAMSVANTYRFGLSNANTTFKHAAGIWDGAISIAANQVSNNSTIQRGAWNQGSFGSVMLSAVAATTGTLYAQVDGIVVTSTTGGTIQVKALASATTSPINILQGSMIRAYKIA